MPDHVSSPADSICSAADPSAEARVADDLHRIADTAVVYGAPLTAPLNSPESPYVLLITDDRVFGAQIAQTLERKLYRTAVICTSDPAAAISRCAAESPDVAILNIDALSLGGIALSRRLKAATPALKVLSLVHGHELEAARLEAAISGSDAVCALLDVPSYLAAMVRELIERNPAGQPPANEEPAMSLQDRIRTEANAFDFSALLEGVQGEQVSVVDTALEPAVERALRYLEPEGTIASIPSMAETAVSRDDSHTAPHLHRPSLKRRILGYAIGAVLLIAAVGSAVILFNPRAVQSDNRGGGSPPQPTTPDIDLTARKGLPFPLLTPGERLPTAQADGEISAEIQQEVFKSYGMGPDASFQYVVIRLIPAALGGTQTRANLFPTTPWFADLKARLDKRLMELVTAGQLSPEQAVAEITENWVRASHRYYIRNYGIDDPHEARRREDEVKWE